MASVEAAAPQRPGLIRRAGCGLLLIFWFCLLLTPCGLFYLAANQEFRLDHREIPQPHAHPWLLISLISEQTDRGIRIERSSLAGATSGANRVCVETSVRFLLWEASGGNQDTRYCDCYQRADTESSWQLEATFSDAC